MAEGVEALEAHLRAHGDDDEAWLVYGDHLTDIGDPRGEIIRWDYAAVHGPIRGALDARARSAELANAHGSTWFAAFEGSGVRTRTAHGFVRSLKLYTRAEPEQIVAWLAHPSCRLLATLEIRFPVDAAFAQRFAEITELKGLPELLFAFARLPAPALAAIARSPHLDQLGSLSVTGSRAGDGGMAALADATFTGTLHTLNVSYARMTSAGLDHVLGAFRGLRWIRVQRSPLGPDAARSLARVAGLVRIDAGGCGFGDLGAEVLSEGEPSGLAQLELSENEIGPAGARAIAASARLEGLTSLVLDGNPLENDGVVALAESAHLGRLRNLSLAQTQVGDRGAVALARGSLPKLASLDLSRNEIGDVGVDALCAFDVARVFRCRLTGNPAEARAVAGMRRRMAEHHAANRRPPSPR